MVSALIYLQVGFIYIPKELTYNFLILADYVDDHRSSFSERLEAKLTDIQVGKNNETSSKVNTH